MKIVDITEKLHLGENKPELVVGDTHIAVNGDAATVLEVMQVIGNGKHFGAEDMNKICHLIFDDENYNKVKGLGLCFEDFVTVLTNAVELVAGSVGESSKN